MRDPGWPRRRRGRRPVRVVKLETQRRRQPDEETASCFATGLHGARLIKRHFEAFYDTHVAQLPITLPSLLGCMVAFWQLIEAAGLPLRWPQDSYGEIDRGETPEDALIMFDGVSTELMRELEYSLFVPRPEYYGLGVQGMFDEGTSLPDSLTLTLWQLFARTPWAVGALPSFEAVAAELGEDVVAKIGRLKPLPPDAPINTLTLYLDIPEVAQLRQALDGAIDPDAAGRMLLEYAFGRGTNDLANYSDYEVEAIHMGEPDEGWDWDDLPRMVELAREAAAIERAYTTWSYRVSRNPLREIPTVAGAIHKAARAAERELAAGSKALIDLIDDARESRRVMEALNAL